MWLKQFTTRVSGILTLVATLWDLFFPTRDHSLLTVNTLVHRLLKLAAILKDLDLKLTLQACLST